MENNMSLRLVIFTTAACGYCRRLKVNPLVIQAQNKGLEIVDLHASPQWASIFSQVSPGTVPAIAVLQGSRVVAKGVGTDEVLNVIRKYM